MDLLDKLANLMLDAEAEAHAIVVAGKAAVAATVRVDKTEGVAAAVIRRTSPPPISISSTIR